MRDQIIAAADTASSRGGFTLDPDQRLLVAQLAVVVAPRPRRRQWTAPRGAYVYGPVGRGKSWIVNAVFDAAPAPKVRVHSHEFFHRLHARVHSEQGNPQALRRALDDIVGARRLLVFDELHIHDPGDARFFTRLLEYVLAHETTIIVTSNYAPDDLLPNPVWHHIMEAGTALIADNLAIHRLAGSIDYRTTTRQRDAGFAAGAWVSSSPSGADRRTTDTRLHLGRRSFPVVAVDDRLGHVRSDM